jgi:hypothetical protein
MPAWAGAAWAASGSLAVARWTGQVPVVYFCEVRSAARSSAARRCLPACWLRAMCCSWPTHHSPTFRYHLKTLSTLASHLHLHPAISKHPPPWHLKTLSTLASQNTLHPGISKHSPPWHLKTLSTVGSHLQAGLPAGHWAGPGLLPLQDGDDGQRCVAQSGARLRGLAAGTAAGSRAATRSRAGSSRQPRHRDAGSTSASRATAGVRAEGRGSG